MPALTSWQLRNWSQIHSPHSVAPFWVPHHLALSRGPCRIIRRNAPLKLTPHTPWPCSLPVSLRHGLPICFRKSRHSRRGGSPLFGNLAIYSTSTPTTQEQSCDGCKEDQDTQGDANPDAHLGARPKPRTSAALTRRRRVGVSCGRSAIWGRGCRSRWRRATTLSGTWPLAFRSRPTRSRCRGMAGEEFDAVSGAFG